MVVSWHSQKAWTDVSSALEKLRKIFDVSGKPIVHMEIDLSSDMLSVSCLPMAQPASKSI